jgi:hypothetical protein
MKKPLLVAGGVLLALVIGFAGYTTFADRSTPPGQVPLAEVDPQVFEQFKRDFNEARGQVRVIALLSPT